MKKITIELPDQLGEKPKAYLTEHPEESIAEQLSENALKSEHQTH